MSDWKFNISISKRDSESRLAFGCASVVTDNDGSAIIDHQGHVIPVVEIEKAAYAYVQDSRVGGEQHEVIGVASLVESVVITPEKRKAMAEANLGVDPEGPSFWWVGMHVNDDKVWEKVKSGEYPEFSIAGVAMEEPI